LKAGKRRLIMIRMMLSDAQWDRIEPLLPGKAGDPGRAGAWLFCIICPCL
jgi:hypothetical protein